MSREWRMFLGDMREACDRILAYSDELGRDTFDQHGIAYDAIVRNVDRTRIHGPHQLTDWSKPVEHVRYSRSRLQQLELESAACSSRGAQGKAASNLARHGVSFEEAQTCFYDSFQIAFYDADHSDQEDRELLIGHSNRGRLLIVSYTLRGQTVRLISARRATRTEAEIYAQGI